MKYYKVDILGDLDNEYCLLEGAPENCGVNYYRMAVGEPMADYYPANAEFHMSEESPSIKMGSLIGSTKSFLILHESVVEVIKQFCQEVEIEYLPFTLFNLKGRVHRKDFYIVNPIGTVDCLNHGASKIERFHQEGDPYDGDVIEIDEIVLDPQKLQNAPALFRIREDPSNYFIDENLAKAFTQSGFKNIILEDIRQEKG